MKTLFILAILVVVIFLHCAELPRTLDFLSQSESLRNVPSDLISVRFSSSGKVVTDVILHGYPSIARISEIGGVVGSSRNGVTTVTIEVQLLKRLENLDGVTSIYPSFKDMPLLSNSTSNSTNSGNYYGCDADAVQALNVDGSGVLIGVIDTTNLNWQHEDL